MKILNWTKNAVAKRGEPTGYRFVARANAAAKQIGELMRAGKKEEAEAIKAKPAIGKRVLKSLANNWQ
jgi:hypothetical protein